MFIIIIIRSNYFHVTVYKQFRDSGEIAMDRVEQNDLNCEELFKKSSPSEYKQTTTKKALKQNPNSKTIMIALLE